MELNTISNLLEEIEYLKRKARLCDLFLRHYNTETMTVDVPAEWKNPNRITEVGKANLSKSPRHSLNKEINNLLPQEEAQSYVNYDELYKTMKD